MTPDQYDEYEHDMKQYCSAIYQWKAHIVRSIRQETCKQRLLENLTDKEVLIIQDFAMKFLPRSFREAQSDWFAKKGLSWHLSVGVHKRADEYLVECYIHLLQEGIQDWVAVGSITTHLMEYMKNKYPTLERAFLRSDNAGCYHNIPLMLCYYEFNKTSSLKISRVDFSEACSGKDLCDRRASPVKGHMINYVNSGGSINNVRDMKLAIESHTGVSFTRCAILSPDKNNGNYKLAKHMISTLNNFSFPEDNTGIRVWKAYRIGCGKVISSQEIQRDNKKLPGKLKPEVVSDFPDIINKEYGSLGKKRKQPDNDARRRHPRQEPGTNKYNYSAAEKSNCI